MKVFQVFLASSINEFKDDRTEVGDFIRKINNILIEKEIHIKLFECEFCDNHMALDRMQERYNQEIRVSQVFIMLIGKRAGQYTVEEYTVAINSNVPSINILFEDVEQDESVISLKNSLDERVKTYTFNGYKQMLYNIAKILEEILKDIIEISTEEDKVIIDNEIVKF